MLHPHILHNQTICLASDRVLSPGQVGLLSGWGVFSTLRVADGVLFEWDRHWARICRDAELIHVAVPADPEALRLKLLELLAANRAVNATLRLAIVRNGGGMWAGPSNGRESDIVALTAGIKDWTQGVKLGYQTQARHAACEFAGAKILSWAMNLTWLENAHARGSDEIILLNERGEVAECTSANLFIANGGQVWTPPLSSGCLPGITRELLLGPVRASGIEIGEKPLLPAELEAADEVFITSTTRNLLSVREIEDRPIRATGYARKALDAAFSAHIDRYVAAHKQTQPA